jgi:hypothetical protein
MNETEILFKKTLEDIEKRLSETEPYEILLISGLIRKLFLDDFSLVDQVNREHRIKFVFVTTVPISLPNNGPYQTFWTIQDGLDPDTAPPFKKHLTVNRDQFFQTIVTVVNNHKYTVRDVIQFEANVMGGVHAGSPKTEKERVLKEIDSTFSVGGYASSVRQLMAIARVILKTLDPLRKAINSA